MKKFLIIPIFLLFTASAMDAAGAGLQGDVNLDGMVNISDVTDLIDSLLNQDAGPSCDVDLDGQVSISDVTALIDILLSPTDQVTLTVNGVAFTMVHVEGGMFTMGCTSDQWPDHRRNEAPVHEVTLSGYYIGQTEVTQELWNAVMGKNPSKFIDPQRPVETVSMFACAEFVDKLSELTGKVFRLPTEAEWEFAARGGNKSRHYKYSGSNEVDDVAWYAGNSGLESHPVATKAPNELGIHDMSGNVLEWCMDWYYYYTQDPCVNPVGPDSGDENVYRGGCWESDACFCRNATRDKLDPDTAMNVLGLRVVMNE